MWYTLLSFITILVHIYTTELGDFVLSNISGCTCSLVDSEVNLLLTNSLNKYHPFILYTSIFYLIIMYTYSVIFNLNSSGFYLTSFFKITFNINIQMLFINIVALFLGS